MAARGSAPRSCASCWLGNRLLAHAPAGEMTTNGLQAMLVMLGTFRPALTAPGFRNFVALFSGWVLTTGTHAVTAALVATGVPGRRHHEAFHRFFSRGAWAPDELGQLAFGVLQKLLAPGAWLHVAVDDTLAAKKGPAVFGIGSHLDAVRSTKRQKIFCFGHCWVTLAVVMPVPFSTRTWALPLLFRLYRTVKECARSDQPHRKKTELARDLLDVFVSWTGTRRVELSMDSAYCNDTVMRGLPSSFIVLGSMRPDAVLTAAPKTKRRYANGRPRLRGQTLLKPEALALSTEHPWLRTKALLYGKIETVEYKMCDAQWYRAAGTRLLRIVVVRMRGGRIPFRVFFCTRPQSLRPRHTRRICRALGHRSLLPRTQAVARLRGFVRSQAGRRRAHSALRRDRLLRSDPLGRRQREPTRPDPGPAPALVHAQAGPVLRRHPSGRAGSARAPRCFGSGQHLRELTETPAPPGGSLGRTAQTRCVKGETRV